MSDAPEYAALVERLNATRTVFGDISEADEALRLECAAAITALLRERDEAHDLVADAALAASLNARAAALEEAAKVIEECQIWRDNEIPMPETRVDIAIMRGRFAAAIRALAKPE